MSQHSSLSHWCRLPPSPPPRPENKQPPLNIHPSRSEVSENHVVPKGL